MNVFFDVDYTLISDDGSLRPHVKEVFTQIKAAGHKLYIWSGVGIRWEVVRRHNLEGFIETCYLKPLSNYRDALIELGVDVMPDFAVDDHAGVIMAFGGVVVRPYYTPKPDDKEMLRVFEALTVYKKA